jgi:chromosome segregation ATPase
MGLGGAAEKLQRVANMGEELYAKMNELREQILHMRETVQETHRRVERLENKVDQQGAILEALAEAEGLDVDELLTEVAIEEAEPAITEVEASADETEAPVEEAIGEAEADRDGGGAGADDT